MSGLQCLKKQWREKNEPLQLRFTVSENQRFEIGRRVGDFARAQLSHGVLINGKDLDDELTQTKQHIAQKTGVLFEAAFIHDDVLVKTDILVNCGDRGWTLIEVKSGTKVKDEYIFDAALQYYCLVGAGLKIHKVFIRHINKDCVYPDLKNLFTTVEVTKKVKGIQPGIKYCLDEEKKTLDGTEPDIEIGQHCKKPYLCQYKNECWQSVPQQSIFNIPYLAWDKKENLVATGVYSIDNIPQQYKLSDKQWAHVKMVRAGYPIIDRYTIGKKLAELKYPLYFLDFETDASAIPRFDGMKPYQKFPFQYSCHIVDSNDTLSHLEYLHIERTDPRRMIAERLLTDLGKRGSIIVYNAQFEISVIKYIAEIFPDLKDPLLRLIARIWDQLDIFKRHYSHPEFNGSNSIKTVLPVLVPSLNYKSLEQVQNGTDAGAIWHNAIHDLDDERSSASFENLKAYCKMDTLAMVKIHEHLSNLPKFRILQV